MCGPIPKVEMVKVFLNSLVYIFKYYINKKNFRKKMQINKYIIFVQVLWKNNTEQHWEKCLALVHISNRGLAKVESLET